MTVKERLVPGELRLTGATDDLMNGIMKRRDSCLIHQEFKE